MGSWIYAEDRQPKKRGKYRIMRRTGTSSYEYFWNGTYWVTGGGNPAQSVYLWFDEEGDEDEHEQRGMA